MKTYTKQGILIVTWTVFLFSVAVCGDQAVAGPKAPDFTLPDLSGQMRTLSDYQGSVVILDFWATWCAPCRASIPELIELQEKYRDRDVVVLGVSMDDPRQVPDKYLRLFKHKLKINYPIVRFNRGVIQDYFANAPPAIPTLFMIDREGRIRDRVVGYRSGAVEKSLAKVLK